ncbi:hypothetical protein BU24DRAFT_451181 [Aaosphaeria arxii CBS 175.79]|uniref:WD40 repeat-like protein n=1 Tax=Aaosphaeria arxii CBS 175.79 TaxID=1450172 RepID=A0A6A5XU36_9PLEO|nr:uncharacterized protein BU24DRAFT_451181 [Aaosphaeria arxii CBS 175.79]KAF2016712.1 hypothetical protein BU24DRAFT_451181 [Aaosphaeria arxii CBS 175.79]
MSSSISCIATSVQRRAEFLEELPLLSQYRCNLTCLSHVYNLFIFASCDTIHVYQPTYPDQSLSKEPALILEPPISRPNLGHYVDYIHPHSINHLRLDYLGTEEILLAVCDDGDVIAYTTASIQRAIDQQQAGLEGKEKPYIRPLLHRNVGMSAWGISVHREARLIAISANTANVTVIAFGLSEQPLDPLRSFEGSPEIPSIPHDPQQAGIQDRSKDRVITLVGRGNIPSVSFNNTGADPCGRWLLSSSIHGITVLWDLHNPQMPARAMHVGRCYKTFSPKRDPGPLEDCGCGQVAHATWGAIFIDPRTCRPFYSLKDAFGGVPTEVDPCFWDTTGSRLKRDDLKLERDFFNKVLYPEYASSASEGSIGDDDIDMEDLSGSDVDNDDGPAAEDLHSILAEGLVPGVPPNEDQDSDGMLSLDGSSESGSDQEAESIAQNETPAPAQLQATQPPTNNPSLPPPSPPHTQDPPPEQDATQSDSSSQSDTEPPAAAVDPNHLFTQAMSAAAQYVSQTQTLSSITIPPGLPLPPHAYTGSMRSHPSKIPYYEVRSASGLSSRHIPTPSPCLIITKDEISLLQSLTHAPSSPSSNDPQPTIPTMHNPLFPDEINLRRRLPWTRRLNFSAYIPALGAFVVGSNAGRCAVFALTSVKVAGEGGWGEETVYGFRQEHILPLPEQQEDNVPPVSPMVGMAVGPVQGMLDGDGNGAGDGEGEKEEEDGRRWRLMMLFADHTVWSYEIARKREGREPALGELFV